MEYELIYHTRLYVIIFEITTRAVNATIYNKDVQFDEEWIIVAEDSLEVDAESTDLHLCRELLSCMRKEHNI